MKSVRCIIVAIIAVALLLTGCKDLHYRHIAVMPTQEDVLPDGSLYTPSTQTVLRGHHWLEGIEALDMTITPDFTGVIKVRARDSRHVLRLRSIPWDWLTPRLHYQSKSPPDEFDAFNLMMAEYSRNGLAFPTGNRKDRLPHFETDLLDAAPWTLKGEYDFIPNPTYKPLRIGLINNCLAPGLWELNALDRAGEIYHAWFSFPDEAYFKLTAEVNRLSAQFVREALPWNTRKVKADLSRLRSVQESLGTAPVRIIDDPVGYSSQGSRQKLQKHFAQVTREGELLAPQTMRDFQRYPASFSQFVNPGKYSLTLRSTFDLSFLFTATTAEISLVKPLTNYRWTESITSSFFSPEYLEIQISLNDKKIVIGNLPLSLLVEHEDFTLFGFGVGILNPDSLIERRQLLFKQGPHPSFAYILEERNSELWAVNSHELGLEEIYLRAYPRRSQPFIEIIITSYERMVDVIKYRIPIPAQVLESMKNYDDHYVSPAYNIYRDDNTR